MLSNNKFVLRFFFLFTLTYVLFFPFHEYSQSFSIGQIIGKLHDYIVMFTAEHILNLNKIIQTNNPTGSGDRLYDYVFIFAKILMSLVGTIIWLLIDRKNDRHPDINYFLLTITRYFLAYVLFLYGFAKVLPVQFGEISLYRLIESYGDSSPMGLAWTFFAYSDGYKVFMGLAECLGALLLLHRKTMLLGGLVCIAVVSNIVAVNFFFDIPVKLLSSTLLFMSIIIVIPDMRRLFDFFVLNKSVEPRSDYSPFESSKWSKAFLIIKWLLVLFITYSTFSKAWYVSITRTAKPELNGIFEVKEFIVNGDTIPQNLISNKRWKYIGNEYVNSIHVFYSDKSKAFFQAKIDTTDRSISFIDRKDTSNVSVLDYTMTDSTFHLNGVFQNDTISCKSERLEDSDFLLKSRGFNWVTETPHNR